MRLRFEMSAGDGSIDDALVIEVDRAELPTDEGRALDETIQAVRDGDDPGLEAHEAAEGFRYRLHVFDAPHGDGIDIHYDEPTLPVDLLPLVEHLRDRAIEARQAHTRDRDDPQD